MKTKTWLPSVCCASLILLGGCFHTSDPGLDILTAQLRIANGTLREINAQLDKDIERHTTPDMRLALIPAPAPGATDAELEAYMRSIERALRDVTDTSTQMGAAPYILKIGRGHIPVLARFIGHGKLAPGMRIAFPQLIGPEDKDEMLRLLPKYPRLYPYVKFWATPEELKPRVLAAFKEEKGEIRALESSLREYITTPEDRAYFSECFVNSVRFSFLGPILVRFPEIDGQALFARAWEYRMKNGTEQDRVSLGYSGVQMGNREALNFMLCKWRDDPEFRKKNTYFRANFTPAFYMNDWNATLLNMCKHQDKLVYSPEKQQFIVPRELIVR